MISSGFSMHKKSVRESKVPRTPYGIRKCKRMVFTLYAPYVFQMTIPWENHYHVLTDPLEHQ